MKKLDYSSVPTNVDFDNGYHNKYVVNSSTPTDKLLIPKSLCILLAIGAILLAILTGLIVFFFLPTCDIDSNSKPVFSKIVQLEDIDPRLPTNIVPTVYRLAMIPDLINGTTNGSVTIFLKVIKSTSSIIFNTQNLSIDVPSTILTLEENNKPIPIYQQEEISHERYRINLKDPLAENKTYILSLNFSSSFNPHLQGIYSSTYYDSRSKLTRSITNTQFSPIDARKAFPCFDEPSFKAVFDISIARPSNLTTLFNMPKLGEPKPLLERPGWVWDHFQPTPPLSTYVMGFVISDLQPLTSSNEKIKLWASTTTLPQAVYASSIVPKIVNFLEGYFDVVFPQDKLDIVALPEFGFKGMENWGLITLRESVLLYDKNNTDIEDQKTIAEVLAHELTHQWLGNLVTPGWWNDLWLKEGFATFFQYLAVNEVEPSWVFTQEFLSEQTTKAFEIDSYETVARPLAPEIKNNKQIRQMFGTMSYAKGACVIRMIENFVGKNTFRKALTKYIKQYKYKNANHDDLFETINEVATEDKSLTINATIKDLMYPWIYQPGFPVINVISNPENETLTLSQHRFLFSHNNQDDTFWWIPISIASDNNPNFLDASPKYWLRNESSITIKHRFNEWYIINVNQTGYYMVNYDEANWLALIRNIMNVPALTRAQLIGDAMELAKANLLDYNIPLRLISNMAVKDQQIMFLPTLTAFNKLEFLSDMLVDTPAFGLFEKFHYTIFQHTYRRIYLDETPNDYLSQRIMKTVLDWSCRSPISKCANTAHRLYREWMAGKALIGPNVRKIIYCTAIREGGQPEWEYAYYEYKRSTSPTERNVLLDALGCTKQEWLLSSYLSTLLANSTYSMRIQDADRIFAAIANNKAGNQLAFDFLRKHWDELKSHFGEGFNIINSLIYHVSKHMNTEFQLNELKRFGEKIRDSSTKDAIDRVIESVQLKVNWMDRSYKEVEHWLKAPQDNYAGPILILNKY